MQPLTKSKMKATRTVWALCIFTYLANCTGFHASLIRSFHFHQSPSLSLVMHGGHHHHDHHHDHRGVTPTSDGPSQQAMTITDTAINSRKSFQNNAIVILSSLLVVTPSIIRRRITKLDVGIGLLVIACLTLFDTTKTAFREWVGKIQLIRSTFIKHTTPITKKFFFKNESAADRVTLLGVVMNLLLSAAKFVGGITCNSAVLVADAGHSLSDLFSDFITLWAMQVARLPPDADHPWGHGKFESVGSLFLSLTLLATGLGVGSWSYEKLVNIIHSQGWTWHLLWSALLSGRGLAGLDSVTTATAGQLNSVSIPTWPALCLAGISIISKEWLYVVTRRVGELLNSQLLIANAWHHRSDAFSSVLSLISIAFAMFFPQFAFTDAAGGILVAGMISMSGMEILLESIKQLTDTSDHDLEPAIGEVCMQVQGVLGVKQIRGRSVGNGRIVDVTIQTDSKLSASAAQAIAEKVRWKVMASVPDTIEVSVKTSTPGTMCPLLSTTQRSVADVEGDVRRVAQEIQLDAVVKRVTVYYENSLQVGVEVLLDRALDQHGETTVVQSRELARTFRTRLLQCAPDIIHADILLAL